MHRLFFAIRPCAAAAADAAALGERLRAELGSAVRGRPVAAERLHVTLHWLRDHEALPERLVSLAASAAAQVQHGPFSVLFDRLGSIGDSTGCAVVLKSSDRLVALRAFQRELGAAMQKVGLEAFVRRRFNPHMTLLYAAQAMEERVCASVRWDVEEFVLIDSLMGRSTHDVLGRWPLRSQQLTLDGL